MFKCNLIVCSYPTQVRIPFSSFRPMDPDAPPLDPFLVHTLAFRFEPRRQVGHYTIQGRVNRTTLSIGFLESLSFYLSVYIRNSTVTYTLVMCPHFNDY